MVLLLVHYHLRAIQRGYLSRTSRLCGEVYCKDRIQRKWRNKGTILRVLLRYPVCDGENVVRDEGIWGVTFFAMQRILSS